MAFPKLNLLIVENNRFLANVLQQTLANDYSITVASNGFEAMAMLERGLNVDFLITDLNLPKFDGLELTQLIRNSIRYQTLPILVLSDSSDSGVRISCLENGADDCIAKPFNPFEVQAKIRAMLRRTGSKFPRVASVSNHFFPGLYSLNLN